MSASVMLNIRNYMIDESALDNKHLLSREHFNCIQPQKSRCHPKSALFKPNAVSNHYFFVVMTGLFAENVGIIQAYFRADANNTLPSNLIFVGINVDFSLFDTASVYLNCFLPFASDLYFAVLMQHYLFELGIHRLCLPAWVGQRYE